MFESHYLALAGAYAVAMLCWLGIARWMPALWPREPAPTFAQPWREIGWALLAALAVLGLGQLYLAGWRLPQLGRLGVLFECVNQLLIFAPLLLLLAFRRHSLATAWVRTDRVAVRIGVGLFLALLALLAFAELRRGAASWLTLAGRIYHPRNAAFAVQVLLEDIAIAIFFVRLRAAVGLRISILLVAALFAAAHVPALVQHGATAGELAHLMLDTALGVGIVAVVQRSADVWWFWCVHFTLDMTQFPVISGAA